ncbi:MAG: RIP metalloprotease RseP [candidate division KSB1 bacterium]|nr:RIP metalloprotease RseP [candidate division KSB1 bacterium]MDZ7346358.1 RIP metalloprotease RseP [candidate division KSB1 bacterium]
MSDFLHTLYVYGLPFAFIIGLLVLVHEFGHFLLAKLVGIRVERFSIGFPPRLFGKKIGDTDYCISAVPLGGYVKMSGMIDESLDTGSLKGEPYEFMSKPVWARFLVIAAGPIFNILLAFFLYTMIIGTTGIEVPAEPLYPIVGNVSPNSPADSIGLKPGDRILSIDGRPVEKWEDLTAIIHKAPNRTLDIEWERDGKPFFAHVTPKYDPTLDVGLIGIMPQTVRKPLGPFESVRMGALMTVDKTTMILKSFAALFTGKVKAKEALGGPLRIAELSGQVAKRGFIDLLAFAAILSINLALLNLLPVPALDGGHLLLLTVEAFIRRPISNKIKIAVQQIGMALLLALMIFVLFNDFLNLTR